MPSTPAHAAPTACAPTACGTPLLSLHNGRATITLNRPAQHNRLHVEDLLALQRHFQTLAADAKIGRAHV